MTTRLLTTVAAIGLMAGAAEAGPAGAYDAPVELDLTFVFHIDEDLAEQDVYVERVKGSGQVFRATRADRDMAQPLYTLDRPMSHDPFDPEAVGPYPMGRELGLTLGEWFEAKGEGRYACEDGEGRIDVAFENMIPNATYTMWHFFTAWPPTDPFNGTYDVPIGSRDGEQSVFVADEAGGARFQRTFKPCLQLSGEHLVSGLGVAWHSDGRTWGSDPGEFPTQSHIQLYVMLPPRAGI